MSSEYWLKGSNFQNRYRIEGTLTTIAPLHIGSGEELLARERCGKTDDEKDQKDKKDPQKQNGPEKISGIAVDFQERPYIPGSTLRGNLRSWLWQILRALPTSKEGSRDTLAWEHDFETMAQEEAYKEQKKQIEFMKDSASVLERIFGTSFSATKLDVYDALCTTNPEDINVPETLKKRGHAPHWDAKRFTYITQSVAIDSATGTAANGKLYHFEVVPKGISFAVTLVGQNLDELEVGMILAALEGFNSQIFPLTLGAMNARGFGRLQWELDNITRLQKGDISGWLESSLDSQDAGYEYLKKQTVVSKRPFIEEFKKRLYTKAGGAQ